MSQIVVRKRILTLQGHRVMLDADLARMFGVTTKALNQAVRRNPERFPSDFMFRLSPEETEEVVTNCDHLEKLKFSRFVPSAFTEHGVVMLANVLNSPRAVQASIQIVRAFVRMRQMAFTHEEVVKRLKQLEAKLDGHDRHIGEIFRAIRELMEGPGVAPRRIGFHTEGRRKAS